MSRSPTSCCPADQRLCTRGKGRGSSPHHHDRHHGPGRCSTAWLSIAYDLLQGRFAGDGCADYDSPGPVTISGLPAGTYVIRAEDEWNGRHVSRYLGGTTTAKKATRVTVTTGEAKAVPCCWRTKGAV